MRASKRNKGLLRELNSIELPLELFQGAIDVLEGFGEDHYEHDIRSISLVKFFDSKCETEKEATQCFKSFMFRMWILMDFKDELDISESNQGAYLAVAATEPFISRNNKISFDLERFRNRLNNTNQSDART